jgi:pyruvate dehydrogenase E2 component (dihydrolipoamide acetyltransferase)
MAFEIKMPPLSQTTDTVILEDWLVEEGDTVEKGQSLANVETDKVAMQVESFTAGTVLKLLASPGDEVPVGEVIALVGEPGEEVTTADRGNETEETASAEKTYGVVDTTHAGQAKTPGKPVSSQSDVKANPLVRHFAAKHNVNLSQVRGTGPKGLIVKGDVVRFIEQGSQEEYQGELPYTEQPLSRNQQSVARNLTKSVREIPHYYVKITVYLDSALAWREENQRERKIAIYSLYIYATAKALKSFPDINGYFFEGVHRRYRHINVGFAVAHNQELFVPVVKNASEKSIGEIDREVRQLTAKTKNGELDPDDISGGTCTISNLGVYNADEFSAIVSPGQAAIVAIGTSKKRLIIDEQERMQIRECVTLTGSFDHRIVNGADGAGFLNHIKEILEEDHGT